MKADRRLSFKPYPPTGFTSAKLQNVEIYFLPVAFRQMKAVAP